MLSTLMTHNLRHIAHLEFYCAIINGMNKNII